MQGMRMPLLINRGIEYSNDNRVAKELLWTAALASLSVGDKAVQARQVLKTGITKRSLHCLEFITRIKRIKLLSVRSHVRERRKIVISAESDVRIIIFKPRRGPLSASPASNYLACLMKLEMKNY